MAGPGPRSPTPRPLTIYKLVGASVGVLSVPAEFWAAGASSSKAITIFFAAVGGFTIAWLLQWLLYLTWFKPKLERLLFPN